MDTGSLAELYGYNSFVVNANSEGVSDEDSMKRPQPGGNCMNWVLGHIVCHRNYILGCVGGEPVLAADYVPVYDRGSARLTDAGAAMPFAALIAAFRESQERLLARLGAIGPEALVREATVVDAPDKTIGQMLGGYMFHEAYHAGQLGILRRVIGKDGALK